MAERPSFNYRLPVTAMSHITQLELMAWKTASLQSIAAPSYSTRSLSFFSLAFLGLFGPTVRRLPGLRLQTSLFFPLFLLVSHRCSRACQACVIGSRRKSSAEEETSQTAQCLAGKENIDIFFVPLLLIRRACTKKEKGKIQRRSCRTMPRETLIVEKGETVAESRISETSASRQKNLRPAGLSPDLVMHGTLSAARLMTSCLSSYAHKPYLEKCCYPPHIVFRKGWISSQGTAVKNKCTGGCEDRFD